MLSKILGILSLQQLSLINAAPGQILSRLRFMILWRMRV
jgi:hypothetical protein